MPPRTRSCSSTSSPWRRCNAERDAPGATITTFGDAIWWAIVTVATVGYGDTYPVTFGGRAYAVLLMIGGIAIVGTSSAVVISYLGDRMADAAPRRRGRRRMPHASPTPSEAPTRIAAEQEPDPACARRCSRSIG